MFSAEGNEPTQFYLLVEHSEIFNSDPLVKESAFGKRGPIYRHRDRNRSFLPRTDTNSTGINNHRAACACVNLGHSVRNRTIRTGTTHSTSGLRNLTSNRISSVKNIDGYNCFGTGESLNFEVFENETRAGLILGVNHLLLHYAVLGLHCFRLLLRRLSASLHGSALGLHLRQNIAIGNVAVIPGLRRAAEVTQVCLRRMTQAVGS